MKRINARGIIGIGLVVVGVLALTTVFDHHQAQAADPDRYVFESDHDFDRDFDLDHLELRIEEALAGLEVLEDLELDHFADDLAERIGEALEHGAYSIDRDWPDHVRVVGPGGDLQLDTRRIARQVERMARTIERDVRREFRDSSRDSHRAWRYDDEYRDREDVEAELRDLQREMRRLEAELEEMEDEGDI